MTCSMEFYDDTGIYLLECLQHFCELCSLERKTSQPTVPMEPSRAVNAESKTINFFDLPPEIRNQIYARHLRRRSFAQVPVKAKPTSWIWNLRIAHSHRLVYRQKAQLRSDCRYSVPVRRPTYKRKKINSSNLLLASKRIYHEAFALFMHSVTFSFQRPIDLSYFIAQHKRLNTLAYVQSVVIDHTHSCNYDDTLPKMLQFLHNLPSLTELRIYISACNRTGRQAFPGCICHACRPSYALGELQTILTACDVFQRSLDPEAIKIRDPIIKRDAKVLSSRRSDYRDVEEMEERWGMRGILALSRYFGDQGRVLQWLKNHVRRKKIENGAREEDGEESGVSPGVMAGIIEVQYMLWRDSRALSAVCYALGIMAVPLWRLTRR